MRVHRSATGLDPWGLAPRPKDHPAPSLDTKGNRQWTISYVLGHAFRASGPTPPVRLQTDRRKCRRRRPGCAGGASPSISHPRRFLHCVGASGVERLSSSRRNGGQAKDARDGRTEGRGSGGRRRTTCTHRYPPDMIEQVVVAFAAPPWRSTCPVPASNLSPMASPPTDPYTLQNNLASTAPGQGASTIGVTPNGCFTSTNVQDALEEICAGGDGGLRDPWRGSRSRACELVLHGLGICRGYGDGEVQQLLDGGLESRRRYIQDHRHEVILHASV